MERKNAGVLVGGPRAAEYLEWPTDYFEITEAPRGQTASLLAREMPESAPLTRSYYRFYRAGKDFGLWVHESLHDEYDATLLSALRELAANYHPRTRT